MRNCAYHAAGRLLFLADMRGSFWQDVHGNFFFVAVLEWCKLFNDSASAYHWRKVVEDPEVFFQGLLANLGMTDVEFIEYETTIRTFRNEHVAHMKDGSVPGYPDIEPMRKSVSYLFDHVKATNGAAIFRTDVVDAASYLAEMNDQAAKVYNEYLGN
jgi:hypothetical protein